MRELVFLGWDRPATALVLDQVTRGHRDGPLDLRDTLLILPTQQAARRLREALAVWCDARHTALLGIRTATPEHLLHGSVKPVADDAVSRAVWIETLRDPDAGPLEALFPQGRRTTDVAWVLQTADLIGHLRRDLANAGYSIGEALARFGNKLEERDRWEDLAGLEARYLARIDALELEDAQRARQAAALHPSPDPMPLRIVVAGVPDPSPLAVQALERLADRLPVTVLVHAPPERARDFDEWGRPRPEVWTRTPIDIPDADRQILLESHPAAQARAVARLIASEQDRVRASDLAIGVPDADLAPALEVECTAAGLQVHNPIEEPLSAHPLFALIDALCELLNEDAYAAAAALLRHPDFGAYLERVCRVDLTDALTALDAFQNRYLPLTLDGMRERFVACPRGFPDARDPDATALGAVLNELAARCEALREAPFEDGWRDFLKAVYDRVILRGDTPRDARFVSAAVAVESALAACGRSARVCPSLSRAEVLRLFRSLLAETTLARERGDAVLDLEGWLELPWSPASRVIVTGMNEGVVPGRVSPDPFLPDTVREQMGLRSDRDRLARDSYVLTALIESRRNAGGGVTLLLGKGNDDGDPLKPSRLLFRCADGELVERARRLFGEAPVHPAPVRSPMAFRLQPAQTAEPTPDSGRFSVTRFRDYLACPFRYYLSNVLGMERLCDDRDAFDPRLFGQVVHAVMERMARSPQWRVCTDADALARQFQHWLREEFDGRCGAARHPSVELAMESALQRLETVARRQAELLREWETVEVELDLKMTVGVVVVTGRADRIDRHRKNGTYRILDYKTSDQAARPEKTHLERRREDAASYNAPANGKKAWIDLQLPLYAHMFSAIRQIPAEQIETGYFNIPKTMQDVGVCEWRIPPDELDSAVTCAQGVLGDIARRVFWPPRERVTYDDFKDLFPDGSPQNAFDITGVNWAVRDAGDPGDPGLGGRGGEP
jgi:ATP-dependent helicase/nuclease subunit B